jgi:hypothetical protein
VNTTFLILSLRQYSITVEKSACSTPYPATRADNVVPIRTNVAMNGISNFTGLISLSDHDYGKACAKRLVLENVSISGVNQEDYCL